MLWFTLSIASLRSSKTWSVAYILFILRRVSCDTLNSAVSLIWNFLYAAECRIGKGCLLVFLVYIWLNTALSVTLEMNWQLLIGRKFLYFAESLPSFLSIGFIIYSFNLSEKYAVEKDSLTIFAITGSRRSKDLQIRDIRIGFNIQNLFSDWSVRW